MKTTTRTLLVWASLLGAAFTHKMQATDIEYVIVEEDRYPEINDVYDIADILARIVLENGNEIYMVKHIVARVKDDTLKQKLIKFLKDLAQLKREQRDIKKINALAIRHFGGSNARAMNDRLIQKAATAVAGSGFAGKLVGAVAKSVPGIPTTIDMDPLHKMLEEWQFDN